MVVNDPLKRKFSKMHINLRSILLYIFYKNSCNDRFFMVRLYHWRALVENKSCRSVLSEDFSDKISYCEKIEYFVKSVDGLTCKVKPIRSFFLPKRSLACAALKIKKAGGKLCLII